MRVSFERRLLHAVSKISMIWEMLCRNVWGPVNFKDAASNAPSPLGGRLYVEIGMLVGCSFAASVSRARNCEQNWHIKQCKKSRHHKISRNVRSWYLIAYPRLADFQ